MAYDQVFPTVPNNSTTTINLACLPDPQWFKQGFVSQLTLGTYVGTATVTIKKWDSIGNAFVNLTAATDITSGTQTAKVTFAIPALASLTDAQRVLHVGDSLFVDFITNNTTSVQPTGAVVGAETYLLQ